MEVERQKEKRKNKFKKRKWKILVNRNSYLRYPGKQENPNKKGDGFKRRIVSNCLELFRIVLNCFKSSRIYQNCSVQSLIGQTKQDKTGQFRQMKEENNNKKKNLATF